MAEMRALEKREYDIAFQAMEEEANEKRQKVFYDVKQRVASVYREMLSMMEGTGPAVMEESPQPQ